MISYANPEEYRAADGHVVRSRAELAIDDRLYQHGVAHATNCLIMIGGKPLRYDFYLTDLGIYIEFWGLMDDPSYRQRRDEKVALYRSAKRNLLELFPGDLADLDTALLRVLGVPA